MLAKLELMIGTAHLLVTTAGTDGNARAQEELGELIMYTEMCRSSVRAAELDCEQTASGLVAPAMYTIRTIRAFMTSVSERLVAILRHLGTSSLVGTPMAADFDVPELQPLLERYFRGRGLGARERVQLCKLAWELTSDSFAGRQELYERLHHGDPLRNAALVYQEYDKTPGVDLVRRLLGWDAAAEGVPVD